MTITTESPVAPVILDARRFGRARLVVAFLAGVGLVATIAVGSVLAYERVYEGKVGAGVSVGNVDLSGLTREEAASQLTGGFASFGAGTLTIQTEHGATILTYAELGRHPDIGAMLDAAFAVGRTGDPVQRVMDEARTALRPIVIAPIAAIDRQVLAGRVAAFAATIDRDPVASAVTIGPGGFRQTTAVWGRAVNEAAIVSAISDKLAIAAAPASWTLAVPIALIAPAMTDYDATLARQRAERMIRDVVLAWDPDRWQIPATSVRSWISFGTWQDGSHGPLVDAASIEIAVQGLVAKVNRKPVSATFLMGKGGVIVGVKAGLNGRALDVAGTALAVQTALMSRAAGDTDPSVPVTPVIAVTKPALTSEAAAKAAPLMKQISSWTTYYESGAHNGFGANISLPAMAIDGTVLAPGQRFSFWDTVGEVTFAKGYKLGGAIINGHSVEGKSIGGGICSTSTTIFNAALRAGLEMGIRANHYYYISRYPKGLDATVFKDGASVQDMTFRNDTQNPILIRAFTGLGMVRFTLYSVPTGRTVAFTNPIVTNYKSGYTVIQPTTTVAPGVRMTIEYPADGQDVTVTRTVTDATGKVIHLETYYSHYAQMIGVILVGQKVSSPPTPTPTPTPSPSPTPTPTP